MRGDDVKVVGLAMASILSMCVATLSLRSALMLQGGDAANYGGLGFRVYVFFVFNSLILLLLATSHFHARGGAKGTPLNRARGANDGGPPNRARGAAEGAPPPPPNHTLNRASGAAEGAPPLPNRTLSRTPLPPQHSLNHTPSPPHRALNHTPSPPHRALNHTPPPPNRALISNVDPPDSRNHHSHGHLDDLSPLARSGGAHDPISIINNNNNNNNNNDPNNNNDKTLDAIWKDICEKKSEMSLHEQRWKVAKRTPQAMTMRPKEEEEEDELKSRAESFIFRFKERIRIQREESLLHYMRMVDRGSS